MIVAVLAIIVGTVLYELSYFGSFTVTYSEGMILSLISGGILALVVGVCLYAVVYSLIDEKLHPHVIEGNE